MTEELFNRNVKTLYNVDSGNSLVEELAVPDGEVCALFQNEVKIIEQIGRGAFGKIYSVEIPGKGEKKYVVKIVDANITYKVSNWNTLESLGFPRSLLHAYNPNAMLYYEYDQELFIPEFARECLIPIEMERKFPPIPNNVKDVQPIVIRGPAHLCQNRIYSEFYIGAIVGQAYQDGKCINFFDVHSMFTCSVLENNQKSYKQFILMDKIDGAWGDGANCCKAGDYVCNLSGDYNREIQRGVFLQLMFAIAFYQDRYQISHNDLHSDNLFVEYVNDQTSFNDQRLIEADWYHYHLSEKKNEKENLLACDVYFPAIPVIAKIGDFGLSVKYSEPIVGDQTVFETGYDQNDGDGPWIPNQYYPTYDSIYAAASYIFKLNEECSVYDDELDQMLCFLGNIMNIFQYSSILRPNSGRPILRYLPYFHTAEQLLRSPFVQSIYGQKPSIGTIVTLGIL